jgi:hypothetical protein
MPSRFENVDKQSDSVVEVFAIPIVYLNTVYCEQALVPDKIIYFFIYSVTQVLYLWKCADLPAVRR